MAKKRIIAYFMQEKKRDKAREKMQNIEETDSYLLGDIDEDDISSLEKQGLVVQVLKEQVKDDAGGVVPTVHARVRGPMAAPADKPDFYVLYLKGPILDKWRTQLKNMNMELLEAVSRDTYIVRITEEQVKKARQLDFVNNLELYGSRDTSEFSQIKIPKTKPAVDVRRGKEKKPATYDIRLHRANDAEKVKQWLEDHNVMIAGVSKRKIRVYLIEDSQLMYKIRGLPEVAAIDLYVPPKLHNDIGRLLLGIDKDGGNITSNIKESGDGQIIAVADTGLDKNHPDFHGRVIGIVPLGRPNDASDPNGHGTHVAGSVLGDGSASAGKIKGTAPQAKLFFQSIMDAMGALGGLPFNLYDLFDEAYRAGARIHSNSWGAALGSEYTFDSSEVDEFVAEHRDMLVVFSAGNAGQAATRLHSQPGYVDWLSVGSPASAKNALTVGASRSNRATGGYSQFTWGQFSPRDYPDDPIAAEHVSGDPEGLAAFSSRGPCTDRRIKPDVVAPGTDIVSTKSSLAPLRNFWGPYPGNGQYAFMGGTSMSTPLVSGCAALIREYYAKERRHTPSAALLKATLINSTRGLKGNDALADHPFQPNFHQGFGCVYIPWAIPNLLEKQLKLEYMDTWQDNQMQFRAVGQRLRYRFSVSGGKRLRLCLTWTDAPGRALQNNLNLFLLHEDSDRLWIGNQNLPMKLTVPDSENNVEVIRVDDPPSGDYTVQISATNLLQIPQDFALVITGELDSSLKAI